MGRYLLAFISFGYLLVLAVASTGYDGYKLFKVVPRSADQGAALGKLVAHQEDYDFFKISRQLGKASHVMVKPQAIPRFITLLQEENIYYEVLQENVGLALEEDLRVQRQQELLRKLRPRAGQRGLSTDRYYNYTEILGYIHDMELQYPSRVFLKTVGWSYEKREIKTITITNGDRRPNKNVIFVDGGFHAREWISHSAVLYIIEQLVENFSENADLLEHYDWVILPVVNPDGYEHSQTQNNRFWRKTRKPYKYAMQNCYGADPNRNFGFHWNEKGASSIPCMDTYAGPTAFSEPETQIVRDIMYTLKGRGKMYLTLHSYGNYILYPWGWTEELPETWMDLDEVAHAGYFAIHNATGSVYTVGSSTNVLYIASGGSDDYAYHVGFPISITMELPGGGSGGFNPPPTSIDAMVKETWIGIRAMALKVIEKYPMETMDFL